MTRRLPVFFIFAIGLLPLAFCFAVEAGTCVGQTGGQACANPTPNLGLCRPAYAADPVDLSLNCNLNEIDKKFASTTGSGGHAHTGAAGEGPTLGTAALAFDPATQAELDTHKTSTDHDSRYTLKAGDTLTGALKLPDGTAALPSLTWANEAGNDTGFYYGGTSGRIIYTRNAQKLIGFGGNGLNFPSAYGVHWTANANDPEATPDASIWRDVTGQLAQRISSTGTTKKPQVYALYNLYGTDTAPTSTESVALGWDASNRAILQTGSGGTNGVARDLYVGPTGSACLYWQSNGVANWKQCAAGHLLAAVDEAVDIGDGTTDPRKIYAHEYAVNGKNGARYGLVRKTEAITLSGASTTSTITVPRYATLKAIAQRVTTAISGSGVTSYTLKLTNDSNQCQNGTPAITVNATNPGTACVGKVNNHTGADTITITAVGGNFAGGVLRIVVVYEESTPPTA